MAKTSIGSAYVQILPSTEGIGSKLQEALQGPAAAAGESAGSSAGSKLGSALAGAAKVGAAAITAATTATVGFAKSAVDVGAAFDSSMSQVAATLGLTTEDIENNIGGAGDTFQALRDKAQEMGAATNFSASQAAEGLNILAMSGFSAEESIGMVEDVLHLAAAGSMDMASAAGYISGAMKGFNDETKSSGYYADLMAKGATLANTSVAQLGDAMASGAAGAAAYGQTADSMTVALLRLAEQGDVGAAAGTALAASMKDLYTPSVQGAAALEELGVAAYNSDGSARDFNDVVNDLSGALSGMSAEEANAYKQTIFGIQGLNAFNKMTVTGIEKQEQWKDALAAASDGAGEAAKQYGTMTDNLQGDIDIWNSAMDGFKITIADQLMPTVREFVQFGSDSMGQLTAAFQENGLSGAMEALGGILSDGLAMITEMLPSFVEAGLALLTALVQGVMDNLPALTEAAVEIVVMLANSIAENLPNLIESGAQILRQIVDVILDNLDTLFDAALEIITTLAEGLIEDIPNLVDSAIEITERLVDFLIEHIDVMIDAALEIILALADGIIESLPKLLEKAPEIIAKLVDAIIENVPKLIDASIEIIVKLAEGIIQNLPQLLDSAAEIVFKIAEGIVRMLGELVKKGKEIVDSVKDGFSQKVQDAKNWGRDLINNFVGGIKEKWENLKSTVSNVASTVKSFLGFSEPELGPLADFHTYAPDMMELFARGIRENRRTVTDEIAEAFDFSGMLTPRYAPQLALEGVPAAMPYGYETEREEELRGVREDLRAMLQTLSGMRVVLDSGQTVGALTTPLNVSMGRQYAYNRRGI